VHVVVPAGIDDPTRPSGGNTFDRRVCSGLAAAGWSVDVHAVPGSWPRPDASSRAALVAEVGRIPDDAVVLLDGLVASPAPDVLVPEADRLRLVALVHMPLGQGTMDSGAREREGAVLSVARSVVTTSAWARRLLLRLYSLRGDRVQVAEPGVDAALLAPGTKTGGALLSVAAVIPGKGQDVLLEALSMLGGLRWRCLCVGSLERDPAFADGLRRRVVDGGMDGRVCFSGPQSGADLARSYASADLLVLPSRGETYGMVVTEALAHGVPVVTAEVGGAPEALGHGADGIRPGLLVPAGEPRALRDALRAWLEDADLRRRLRRAARERRGSLPRWSTTTSAVAEVLAGAAR
jgi:glycosyltransferase involved in cell wall biosynthesis